MVTCPEGIDRSLVRYDIRKSAHVDHADLRRKARASGVCIIRYEVLPLFLYQSLCTTIDEVYGIILIYKQSIRVSSLGMHAS